MAQVNRWLALVLIAAGAVLLVGGVLDQNLSGCALSLLLLLFGVRMYHQLRRADSPEARRQAELVEEAALGWTPQRLGELAESHGLSTGSRDRIALIKCLRAAEPGLSLLRAKQLVDQLEP